MEGEDIRVPFMNTGHYMERLAQRKSKCKSNHLDGMPVRKKFKQGVGIWNTGFLSQ
jgi:hypothetical protein